MVSPAISRALYFDTAPRPRALLHMDGHFHTGWTEWYDFGDYDRATCFTHEQQHLFTRQYVIPWFLLHLAGDRRHRSWADGSAAAGDIRAEVWIWEL